MSIKVVVYGLGSIGTLVAKKMLEKSGIKLVGAIEIDPRKVNRDLGEVLGVKPINVPIIHDDEALNFLQKWKPDVVVLTTGTYLDAIYPQIEKCIVAKAHVVSTSETLVYPWYRYPELADKIDRAARENNVSVLGTGVNPGFIFDSLLAFFTSVCTNVKHISAIRSINASKRRYSFQRKIGLGLSVEEFNKSLDEGKITGHVGYAESILLLSSFINIEIERVVERQEPVIADKYVETEFFKINEGEVKGIRGEGVGYINGREFIKLELIAAVGIEDYDEIVIEGDPPQRWRNTLGLAGDIATVGMIINTIPKVLNAPRGLITMRDITIPSIKINVGAGKYK